MSKLAEIKKYLSKMTPGPWNCIELRTLFHIETGIENPAGGGYPICSLTKNHRNDAHGIYRLRSDAEWLVRRCEDLEWLVKRCEELEKGLTAIVHGAMAAEDDQPCSICRPTYENRHEEECPILAAERLLGKEG